MDDTDLTLIWFCTQFFLALLLRRCKFRLQQGGSEGYLTLYNDGETRDACPPNLFSVAAIFTMTRRDIDVHYHPIQ